MFHHQHDSQTHTRALPSARLVLAFCLTILVTFTALQFTAPAAHAAVEEHTIDGVIYQVDPTNVAAGAVVKSCLPRNEMPSTELHFAYGFQTPDSNVYAIRSIAPSACSGRGLTALTLPSGLQSLGSRAFENNSITTVEIPRSIETIPEYAFAQNTIKSIDFGEFSRLKAIERNAFYFNDLTGTLKLPAPLRNIGVSAFEKNALQGVEFPDNIDTIERSAFGSNWIASVDLPQNVKRVEAGAFDDNRYLTRVQLEGAPPAAVTNTTFGPPASVLVNIHRERGYPESPALWNGYTTRYLENYVSFSSQGGSSVDRQTVNYGAQASAPPNPSRDHYSFTGWYTDADAKTTYVFSTPVVDNLTLYAGWKIAEYAVDFDSQGGSAVTSQSVEFGKTASEPTQPTRANHTFTGWYTDTDTKTKYKFDTPVTSALTLYAGWKVDTYNVTFDSQGGSAVAAATIDHGKPVTEPAAPTLEGHTFTGWYTDKDTKTKYKFDTPVTSALTLYAGWSLNAYAVTFDSQGGSAVAAATIDHGKPVTEPAAPTLEGHTFTGWYTDKDTKTKYKFDTPVTSALTLYAGWSLNAYAVTFDSQGGSAVAAATIDHGKPVTEPAAPTLEGHTFTGWYTDKDTKTKYKFDTPVTSALTLYAGWSLNAYAVTFDSQGGSAVAAATIDHGKPVTEPAAPTLEGHTFTGWYTDKDTKTKYKFDTPVTSALTLYAGWTAETYEVTFSTDGGSALPPMTVTYGELIPAPEPPIREHYSFTGWHTDSDATALYDFDQPVTGPIHLYAGWKIDAFTITFNTGEGSSVEPASVDYGGRLPIPMLPHRNGYSFVGWFTDEKASTKYDFTSSVTQAFTLYAGWKANEPSVDVNGGNAGATGGTTGTHPTTPGGLTHTGGAGVPVGVWIGIGALVLVGGGLAFAGLRKRKNAQEKTQSTED
ncbi:InlB B-repeat-containing protein [Leucobacter sp. CX328]|uniref:InlB B-repeat-containing protein n=1 Tax=unclassified Leucobacter TaxID=2621730 RepID=UPI00165E7BF7